jgi:hypothetical protein
MYAALVEDGTVVQVIVGDAAWARARLGGEWVGTETLVGIGWQLVDGLLIAPEVEREPELDADLL